MNLLNIKMQSSTKEKDNKKYRVKFWQKYNKTFTEQQAVSKSFSYNKGENPNAMKRWNKLTNVVRTIGLL